MVLTPSTMLELGTVAPDFTLFATDGRLFALADHPVDKGLLVIFMCNHCPYVIHIREKLVKKILEYQDGGITVVAINSNDFTIYPDDAPEQMQAAADLYAFSFPYLIDADQDIAKAYKAACTPDFFLFDGKKRLVYRGQFDQSRPGNTVPVSGEDLTAAIDCLISNKTIAVEQKPSMGCNIKWKKGNAPDYFQ